MDLIQQFRDTINEQQDQIQRRGVIVHDEMNSLELSLGINEAIGRHACQAVIKNAVNYNRPNGKIILMPYESSNQYGIVVADTGIGMKPDQAKAVKAGVEKGQCQSGLIKVWELLQSTQGQWLIESQINVGTQITLYWQR